MQTAKNLAMLSTALTLLCLVGSSPVGAASQDEASPLRVSLVQPPIADAPQVVVEAPVQALESGVSYCKPACITYRSKGRCRRICCNGPTIETVLAVPDCRKCGCGCFAVPVCIPGCCTDAPRVSCRHGIFGRGVAVYTWCCGYKVVVNLTKCGDVIVTQICS